jgi:hypothetical protein
MSQRRARTLIAAGVSASVLAGFSAAESSATTPDTLTESSNATSDPVTESSEVVADTVAETSVETMPETAAVEILPPDEPWGGVTRGEWDARSFQWWVSMPADINPSLDVTGESCGHGQSGPMFFLPGWIGNEPPPVFRCVVAEGTAIYAPVIGTECSTVEPPPFFGRTEVELRACATEELDRVTDVQARINGQGVADLEAYRVGSPLFTLTCRRTTSLGWSRAWRSRCQSPTPSSSPRHHPGSTTSCSRQRTTGIQLNLPSPSSSKKPR